MNETSAHNLITVPNLSRILAFPFHLNNIGGTNEQTFVNLDQYNEKQTYFYIQILTRDLNSL